MHCMSCHRYLYVLYYTTLHETSIVQGIVWSLILIPSLYDSCTIIILRTLKKKELMMKFVFFNVGSCLAGGNWPLLRIWDSDCKVIENLPNIQVILY